jgi:signal transduction histidine kinase
VARTICTIFIVAGLCLSCAPSARERDDRDWQQAERLWQRGEHGVAFSAWQALSPSQPHGREAHRRLTQAGQHYRHAVELFRTGQPGVRETLVAGMALGPMDPALYLPLARACRAREMTSRAADFYRKYLAQSPSPADAAAAREELATLHSDFDLGFLDRAPEPEPMGKTWPSALALASALVAALTGLRQLRRRRRTLRALVSERPELHQSIAYQLGCLRHEFLKHRVGAVGEALQALARDQASQDQLRFVRERLCQGQPLLAAWTAHLDSIERSLGSRFQNSDPDFRRATRALKSLSRSPLDARHALRMAAAHACLQRLDGQLAAWVNDLARTPVDEIFLREVVDSTRGEWASGRVELDEVRVGPVPDDVEVNVYRADLRIVLKNVIRNAILALDRSPPPRRLAVDVLVDMEPTGDEVVRFRVQDSSPEPLTAVRDGVEHGLGLVRHALNRYDGSLEIGPGDAGFAKAVVLRFFRSQSASLGRAA